MLSLEIIKTCLNRPVIVSIEKKFIYFKPPKTGGTSLKTILQNHYNTITYKYNPEEWDKWLSELTCEMFNDYFKFTFVRNPWDRIVSVYFYFNRPELIQFFPNGVVPSFKDFVTQLVCYKNTAPLIYNHAVDQVPYTHYDGKQFVDFIGRFENLQNNFNMICDKIGLDNHQLPHINTSDHKQYTLYYTPVTRNIISSLYKNEIEVYQYNF